MLPAQQGLTSSYNTYSKTNADASSSGTRRGLCFLAAASQQHHNSRSSNNNNSWTNQDLRNHQPRDREARVMTSLSRPWSKGFPSSSPRRQQEARSKGDPVDACTAGEAAIVGSRPGAREGRRGQKVDRGAVGDAAGDCRWRQPRTAVLQRRGPHRLVLLRREHQQQRGRGGGEAGEGEPPVHRRRRRPLQWPSAAATGPRR